jgi:hypothetical protein
VFPCFPSDVYPAKVLEFNIYRIGSNDIAFIACPVYDVNGVLQRISPQVYLHRIQGIRRKIALIQDNIDISLQEYKERDNLW